MSQRTLSPEIEDRFDDLREEVDRINGNANGAFAKISALQDDFEAFDQRLSELEDKLSEIQADAEMAVSIAAQGQPATDGGSTKAGIARRLSRDEVIRATADGKQAGPVNAHGDRSDEVGSVTVADVKDMAKPQTQLKWKTVAEDAWTDLVEEWPCFRIETPKGGSKRLSVDPDAIPIELARIVEKSLDRDDIANSVVGSRGSGGV